MPPEASEEPGVPANRRPANCHRTQGRGWGWGLQGQVGVGRVCISESAWAGVPDCWAPRPVSVGLGWGGEWTLPSSQLCWYWSATTMSNELLVEGRIALERNPAICLRGSRPWGRLRGGQLDWAKTTQASTADTERGKAKDKDADTLRLQPSHSCSPSQELSSPTDWPLAAHWNRQEDDCKYPLLAYLNTHNGGVSLENHNRLPGKKPTQHIVTHPNFCEHTHKRHQRKINSVLKD